MKCLFCQQICIYSNNEDPPLPSEWRAFECEDCDAIFTFHETAGLTDYQFTVDNFTISCVLTPPANTEVADTEAGEIILKLPYVLSNINPNNFLQKLPTLKVFG